MIQNRHPVFLIELESDVILIFLVLRPAFGKDETVTDPIEGGAYHGTTRDEEVDVSVQTGIEENVDDENRRTLNVAPKDITKQQSKLNLNITPKLQN
jgi:hypothetical protein